MSGFDQTGLQADLEVSFASPYPATAAQSATEVAAAINDNCYGSGVLQNGFEDRDDVDLAWDDSTRTLTISPVATNFSYFIGGEKFTETGNITETISDTTGLWAFYLDSEGSITSSNNPSGASVSDVIRNYAIVAYVYWNATTNDGRLIYELHGSQMSPMTHNYLHFVMRAQYGSGMGLSGLVVDQNGNDDEDAQVGIESGAFYDEDIYISLSAITVGDPIEIWYRSGTTEWRWTETTISGESFPVLPSSGTRLAYNSESGGSWSQTEVSNNSFVLCHIFATNIVNDSGASPKYIAIQGQAEYGNKAAARDGATTEITTIAYGTLALEEIVPVATLIYQTSGSMSNKVAAAIVSTETGDDYVDWRESTPQGGVPAGDHGSLGGLTEDDHQQYLLADGTRAISGDTLNISTSKTPASASATGTQGDICWDSNYIYVCVATNTWKRASLSTW